MLMSKIRLNWWRKALPALVILLALQGCAGAAAPKPAGQAGPVADPAPTADYGVLFTQLSVTGAGSWLDLRYRVTDPAKAGYWMQDTTRRPTLVVERTGTTLYPPPPPPHAHREMQFGLQYYTLYGNTQGAVRPGDRIALQIDGQVVARLQAQ
jgi:hypothetical protein